ncbi:MAG: helix-turn-helix transcriptional regulator [Oscillibacter sp.]|jgi:transcriptional regulator with XRE-family HTH domain|nr:helix-turn-helix transcriptional regulator [Oscillibacter sp.]MCI9001263.1 helix-turn-helix transcriptional regulator [Oscillibacter sp.]
MSSEFSRTLSLLRQEKGVSQRVAAGELGISQALLSHYENGIREPGLAFVVKACDYYGVSADFILGRTLSREGNMLTEQDILDAAEPKNNLRGSVLATLQSKLLSGAVSVLFELLGKLGDKAAINAAAAYLGSAVYQLYRHLYRFSGANESYFALDPNACVMGMADADMKLSEARFAAALRTLSAQKAEFPDTSAPAINAAYPGRCQSLTQVLSTSDARLTALSSSYSREKK